MPEEKERRSLSGIEKSEPVSRIEKIKGNGGEIEMPPVEAGEYLLDYLLEIGPAGSTGMGLAVITFTELRAWQQCAGIELQPWEIQILRRLSADYITEARRAEKPDCPPPFGAPEMEFDRDIVGKKIANAFKAFVRAKR